MSVGSCTRSSPRRCVPGCRLQLVAAMISAPAVTVHAASSILSARARRVHADASCFPRARTCAFGLRSSCSRASASSSRSWCSIPRRRRHTPPSHALGVETSDPAPGCTTRSARSRIFSIARASKGLSEAAAAEHAKHPLFFADSLVARGDADGCVAGCVYTTADVLRAALWLIGTAPAFERSRARSTW